ncbi:Crp/Fnr family transcriptional regulator [Saccharothrix lopnurensis]|uniref:Crp/Fnr family transcriptional regulator n=1 Tax=Saccharothrix lopnurensis TaxID=1670621 RepID=A0ABW1P732_9PSEU
MGRLARFGAGACLMRQGETGDCVMVLRRGHVKIENRDTEGRVRLLGIRRPGELLGEMAFFAEGRRTASVVAHDEVAVVKIPGHRFLRFLYDHPLVQGDILRLVVGKLHKLESKRLEGGPGTAVPRLLRVLVEVAEVYADDPASGSLLVPLTQEELGQLAEISGPSAHRAVQALRRRNLLDPMPRKRKVLVPCLRCLRAALSRQICGEDINGCGGTGECPER